MCFYVSFAIRHSAFSLWNMTRYLGIDCGTRRIGLAVSDPGGTLASPSATLAALGDIPEQARAVAAHAQDYDVDVFVVGLPLHMNGSEGPQAKASRDFGAALERVSGKPVRYWDERLSSVAAEERLLPAGLTRKKKRSHVNRVAAQIILQEFLEAQLSEPKSPQAEQSDQYRECNERWE
jgi:putative Holliday junction resolvase